MEEKFEEFLKLLKISKLGTIGEGGDSYIVDLSDSEEYGKIFNKLDNSSYVELTDDNIITIEEPSSLVYRSTDSEFPFFITLMADWEGDIYSLSINKI